MLPLSDNMLYMSKEYRDLQKLARAIGEDVTVSRHDEDIEGFLQFDFRDDIHVRVKIDSNAVFNDNDIEQITKMVKREREYFKKG